MNTEHLEVPRILYRGPDDHGALPSVLPPIPLDRLLTDAQAVEQLAQEAQQAAFEPTEICRVESREALEQKLGEGWRLHRRLETDAATDAEVSETSETSETPNGETPKAGKKKSSRW